MRPIPIKTLLLAGVILLAPLIKANAQQTYRVGLGLKAGSPLAASVKVFVGGDRHAIEALGTFGAFGGGSALLYEYHNLFSGAPGLSWYFGGGGHCAYVRRNYYNPYADIYYDNNLYAGIDGIIGLEYIFDRVPIALSIDALPIVSFGEPIKLWWNAGFSIKYVFK